MAGMGGSGCDRFRHGRHQLRRLADPRRQRRPLDGAGGGWTAGAAADARHPHGRRGGGSVAWLDGGALRGATQRGRRAGPGVLRRGGEEPTVTDANLVLGRLDGLSPWPAAFAWMLPRRPLRPLAAGFRSLRAAAEGVVAVANQEMVRAIRVVSVERGHDPRGLELVAFRRRRAVACLRGGRGARHAPGAGAGCGRVLSALGIAVGERRRDAVPASVMRPLDALPAAKARDGAVARSRARCDRTATCDLRYAGQGFELGAAGPLRTLSAPLPHQRHAERWLRRPGGAVEPGQPARRSGGGRRAVRARGTAADAGRCLARRRCTWRSHAVGGRPGWTAAAGDGAWSVSR